MVDQPPALVQILADHGGSLGERMAVVEWLRRAGIAVEIRGLCDSACAWLLTLPRDQVCIFPNARLGSHIEPGSANDRIVYDHGRDLIARGYRSC
jgi:hypothetical protein